MARSIPIRNIYYLLLYAWNRLPEGRSIDVSAVSSPDLLNLLSKVLLDAVHQLRRRGFACDYIEVEEDLMRPRGRILLNQTLNRALIVRSRVACCTDEFSRDVLQNQIIKATLERLAVTEGVEQSLRHGLKSASQELVDVRVVALSSRDFGRVQLHANNALYGFLLRICALIYEALIPEPVGQGYRFRDVLADPQTMGRIFQDFVRNFFRLEQKSFSVKSESYSWPVELMDGRGAYLLPSMNTDVSLSDGARTIVVECKWTSSTLQTWRGKKTLRSDHLYQLSAYVRYRRKEEFSRKTEGILLYPLVDDALDVSLTLEGQRIRARTLDLHTDWPSIREQLLGLLEG